MAIGVGDLGQITEDFTDSLNETFGRNVNSSQGGEKGGNKATLTGAKIGGTQQINSGNWVGNARGRRFRYGFVILTLEQIRGQRQRTLTPDNTYFLDIPPQNIMQKEIFANQIQATRRGVIVETEGVVFKDIIIQGTTGVFPGKRGDGSQGLRGALSNPTAPPSPPAGVDADTGRSSSSNVSTISGYEEFIRLRQFFLKYASQKVESDGNRFLVFVNEKDEQQIIVEPLEFNMMRTADSPMTYNYKVVLKGIQDLNGLFNQLGNTQNSGENESSSFLQDVGAISENISATISRSRDIFNDSVRFLSRISQSIENTINGPLRQLQFATSDINDGLATVLSLPEILYRNVTDTILNIQENIDQIGNTVNSAFGGGSSSSGSSSAVPQVTKAGRLPTAAEQADAAALFNQQQEIVRRIQNDSREPVPRSFTQNTKNQIDEISNQVADFIGLGDPTFDAIKGRTNTANPDPTREVSDQEIRLLGAFVDTSQALNIALASNVLYEGEAEVAFETLAETFRDPNTPEEQQINIRTPNSVRQVLIQQGDTLERIAQREYGNALRWLDLVVLNDLKSPYISDNGEDGTLAPGEQILIGDQ